MATGADSDETSWAAEKRSFVADARDEAADRRDIAADVRDVAADSRDAQLDRWEKLLQARAEELGLSAVGASAGSDGERRRSKEKRDQGRLEREAVKADRDAASQRREVGDRPTLLAWTFAGIADALYDAGTYDEVLARIAQAAVDTLSSADEASVTLRQRAGYKTVGATSPAARAVDEAQYEVDEGPSLDALASPMVSAPAFPDERWPALADQPTAYGVESSLSYRLDVVKEGRTEPTTGALNIYASDPGVFVEGEREIGFILAVHASLAARAVGERTALEKLDRDLEQALLSRDVIGQAKGILMERLKVTPEGAFDILRRSSQRLNVKLRELARTLTETGEHTGTDL